MATRQQESQVDEHVLLKRLAEEDTAVPKVKPDSILSSLTVLHKWLTIEDMVYSAETVQNAITYITFKERMK
jgi:hypothetical protein